MNLIRCGLVTLFALATQFQTAQANEEILILNTITANPIHIQGLEAYAGKGLHVFYVSAREPAISTPGATAKVRSVLRALPKMTIPKSGIVDIPNSDVPRDNFMSFNSLMLAVTSPDLNQLYLRNLDQTPVSDLRISSPQFQAQITERDYEYEILFRINTLQLAKLPRTTDQTILMDAKKDLVH